MESSASARRVASAVLVLHDLFSMTFTDIAATVGRTRAAVRQLAARARAHIEERTPRVPVAAAAHAAAVHRFLNAAAGGDIQTLVSALDPEVTLVSDGGGEVWAARRPIVGRSRLPASCTASHS
jgi:RNA polymerase sigma-70 factor (ECF subfamily)